MTLNIKQPGMKHFIIGLMSITLITFNINAQKNIVDVLTLKNGDIYRGIIAEQPDSQIVRINTLCHNTLNFNINDITSITSEEINLRRSGLKLPFHYESRGYVNITDFGLLIGSGGNAQNAIFSVSSVNGYTFSSRFITGAGIGLELYETLLMPLYADMRVILLKSRIMPYAGIKAGYSFSLEDPSPAWGESYDAQGGFTWGAGAGIFIWTGERSSLEINLSYRYQAIHTETTYEWSETTSYYTTKYNRLELRFGFSFQ
jgi:hypothetical protein